MTKQQKRKEKKKRTAKCTTIIVFVVAILSYLVGKSDFKNCTDPESKDGFTSGFKFGFRLRRDVGHFALGNLADWFGFC